MRHESAVHHKSLTNPAIISAVEFFLPAIGMPSDVQEGLPRWISQFVGKQPSEAKALLVERWKTIQNPALREMRDRLLEFEPNSIAVHQGQGWLSLRTVSEENGLIGDSWYLPAPAPDSEWEERWRNLAIANCPVFLEFLRSFAGLREDIPNNAGNFLYTEPWDTFPLPGHKLSEINGAKDWQGSLIVYWGRCGDGVLLHHSGRVAWWLFAEHEVIPAHSDFDSFINYFTAFSRKYSYPFEPEAPDDAVRRPTCESNEPQRGYRT